MGQLGLIVPKVDAMLADIEAREWVGAAVSLVDGGNDVNLVEA